MNKVFVLGSLNMDFMISVDHMPKMGETIQGYGFQSSPGGKGSNQAVALAKQGIETHMMGSVGDDMIGEELRQSLKQYQVHDDFVDIIEHQTSGIAMIILEQDDNRIITNAGANAHHKINKIEQYLNQNGDLGDWLLAQLEVPLDIVEKSFAIAKNIGMKTVLNAAPIKEIDEAILNNVDLLIVNETEAERLIKSKIANHAIDEAMKLLKQLGPSEVILTLGIRGSHYFNGKTSIYTPAYSIDQVVDTTGAGDAFIGSYLAQKIKGNSNESALQFASACGAITITKKGVHHAIPDTNEIKIFMDKRGYEHA